MDTLDTGENKLKKICEILKNETLEPAKEQAQQIISEAQERADRIIQDAKTKAGEFFEEAKKNIDKEKVLFNSSVQQACKQGLEALRQDIEERLFNDSISDWLTKETNEKKLVANLGKALVEAIEKEGTSADFSLAISKNVKKEEINALLGQEILSKLKEKSVTVGDFIGGVQLRLHDKKLTLDLSDSSLKELLARYLHRSFRELLFKAIPEER